MSVVTVDELFSWRDELGKKAFEHFGRRHRAYVSPQTYEDIRERCLMRCFCEHCPPSMNNLELGIIDGLPDGLLIPREDVTEYVPISFL